MSNPVSVKWFTSAMSGAPALDNSAGSILGVLDACLKDGFGSVTLASLVVASGVATGTVNTGHGFLDHAVVLVAGATPAGLNGDQRITVTGTNTFTFDATGISDQTATGTITAKMSPLGYTKAAGTNIASYRADDVTGNRLYLRVDDTNTTYCRVRGFTSITDLAAGTGNDPFPTDTQLSGGGYLYKATSTNRAWTLFGDGRLFYFFCDATGGGAWVGGLVFGDIASYVAGDSYGTVLCGSSASSGTCGLYNLNAANSTWICRPYTKLGTAITSARYSHAAASSMGSTSSSTAAYPDPASNALRVWPVETWEGTAFQRGLMPGLWNPVHYYTFLPAQGTIFSNCAQLPGRRLFMQKMATNYSCVMDMTGPWR